jgi:pre-mRNA-processing factor 19
LIEQYINEHGTEPNSGDALTSDDLLAIHSSRIVRPRPPTLTSIPALLATFQNEWDALALETYNLKEQLARTREELATALYQHDAAVRVIARLSRERDEARDALSKVSVTEATANGEEMAVDTVEGLPEALGALVDETHQTYVKHLQDLFTFRTNRALVFRKAERNDPYQPNGPPPMISQRSTHKHPTLPRSRKRRLLMLKGHMQRSAA